MKKQHLLPKTTFLLKMSNNDAMVLPATNIAPGAHDDNLNQNPSEILRFLKNLDFWQFLKLEFAAHIWRHEYDLSNITNWQHINRETSARNFCRKFCLPMVSQLNFHLWCRFFQMLIKSTIFGNKSNKCCF